VTLKEVRELWEKSCGVPSLVVTKWESLFFATIYVVLPVDNARRWCLNRYFQVGDGWECSVDVYWKTLAECLAKLNDDLEEIYPRCL
jgi:hypothetical protein